MVGTCLMAQVMLLSFLSLLTMINFSCLLGWINKCLETIKHTHRWDCDGISSVDQTVRALT